MGQPNHNSSKCIVYIDDISNGQERFPISFINEFDDERPPQSWKFTSVNIPGSGCIRDYFESGFEGCKCTSVCSEDSSCACVNRFGPSYSASGHILRTVIDEDKPLIECGPFCSCQSNCSHRVVQNGITLNLQVFKTETKGFGLKTLESIPKCKFVCEYAGEVIGKSEACRRAQMQNISDSNYIYVLREHGSSTLETIVDPTVIGNAGRFLNHSCSPNLVPVPIRSTVVIPQICMFAIRDITAGEELTYDYSGGAGAVLSATCSNCPTKVCCCGNSNCKGILPFDQMLLSVQ